jgi:Protein of unknown function (DUF3775)
LRLRSEHDGNPAKNPKNQMTPVQTRSLTITTEQVCFIIVKAREFDAKEADDEQDSGSNPSDNREMEVLEDQPNEPVQQEIAEFISAMNEDEQVDLVALAWLGRDPDGTLEDWPAHGRRPQKPAHPLDPNARRRP